MVELLPLYKEDLPQLISLQPPAWNDIRNVFNAHTGRPYFYGLKALLNGQLVGVGEVIYCGDSAWLGNIIVHQEYRKMGFGSRITEHLVLKAKEAGKYNLYLLATEMGASLYAQLGFETQGSYNFYRYTSSEQHIERTRSIIHVSQKHLTEITLLDRKATGEDRSAILKYFLEDAKVTLDQNHRITGFYLPHLGDGLIIAEELEAGLDLLRYRFRRGSSYLVIPEQNSNIMDMAGIDYEILDRKAILMSIGVSKTWNPGMIFSRVGGYLG